MKNKKILISGGGIAGLTLGYWLQQYGFTPVIIEKAPSLRSGGYMIDFWGVGYTVAERMYLLSALEAEQKKYKIDAIDFVNSKNKKIGALKISKVRALLNNRYFNLLRSSIEKAIYATVQENVPVRFNTSITKIVQEADFVSVTFNHQTTEEFDLVIGAEGLRSNTRQLIFGPDEQFERFLQYYTASYTIQNFTDFHQIFLSYTVPQKQIGVYDVGQNQLALFYIYRAKQFYGKLPIAAQQQKLIDAYKHVSWYTPKLLAALQDTEDFYFDAVSQIELPVWHKGRVALVGDAAQAVSLISGQGASLAMAGAYILAGELKNHDGDYQTAFAMYQKKMQPEILRKQKAARKFASSFVPATRLGIFFRNVFTNLLFIPFVSKYLVKKFFSDNLELEEYSKN